MSKKKILSENNPRYGKSLVSRRVLKRMGIPVIRLNMGLLGKVENEKGLRKAIKILEKPLPWEEQRTTSKKLTKKEVQDHFVSLMNSCVEGYDGTWDPTGEGREGFDAMLSELRDLAKHYGVDISSVKGA
jgi:hypothetical protein